MWCAAVRAVGAGCARVLVGRRTACVILVRKQEPLRTHNFAACLHGKDSAFGSLLGVSREQPAEEYLTPQAPAVSFNKADQDSLLKHTPNQPEDPKILKIAIIGAPNAGKSTLSNQLLGRKLFPVSSKVHTTRCQAQGVVTGGNTQLILLDTPGMVNAIKVKRHNLEKSLQEDPWESVKLADVVLVLVDVSVKWMRSSLHLEVLKCLSQNSAIPSILVLNKVDLLKDKGSLLEITNTLTEGVVNGKKAHVHSAISGRRKGKKGEAEANSFEESEGSIIPDATSDIPADLLTKGKTKHKDLQKVGWAHFQEVFMLSAIHGGEVDTLKRYLMTLAKPGEWLFHSDVVTTQSPQEICDNIIREKLLEYLPQEIPYGITQVTNLWEEGSSGELVIMQTLLVAKENHAKLVVGAGGQAINKITNEAGQDLMNAFLCDVRLRLTVKFKK
ncbi:PREDICTED: GTPase Era, mitochondrial [Nanorana parkeri]|uniref:GTPase Era, mitochondrial n=1 Tax=Nanorana parkeri TaxID=125878 RepID=UPI000854F5F4|nr:PREDICTED: GTPase Era, mitochondrial [Nanorana parkeri]